MLAGTAFGYTRRVGCSREETVRQHHSHKIVCLTVITLKSVLKLRGMWAGIIVGSLEGGAREEQWRVEHQREALKGGTLRDR